MLLQSFFADIFLWKQIIQMQLFYGINKHKNEEQTDILSNRLAYQ